MLLHLEPSRLTDLSINNTITHKIGFNGSVIANGIGGRDIRPKVILLREILHHSGGSYALRNIWIRISRRLVIPSITVPDGQRTMCS